MAKRKPSFWAEVSFTEREARLLCKAAGVELEQNVYNDLYGDRVERFIERAAVAAAKEAIRGK